MQSFCFCSLELLFCGVLVAVVLPSESLLRGLPLSLFPSIFPSKMIFPSPRFFSDDQNTSAFPDTATEFAGYIWTKVIFEKKFSDTCERGLRLQTETNYFFGGVGGGGGGLRG